MNGIEIPAGSSSTWNYHPKLPIDMSPVFDFPPKPKAALTWLLRTWTKISPPVSHMTFALVAFLFFWPSMSEMSKLSADWMLSIFGINLIAALILETALHLDPLCSAIASNSCDFPHVFSQPWRALFTLRLWQATYQGS